MPLPRGGEREAPTGECRPSRQITLRGSRHSNSAKVELLQPLTTSWSVGSEERKKEGRKRPRASECIALLKLKECLARIATAATTIIMMATGAGADAPLHSTPLRSLLLFRSLSPVDRLLSSIYYVEPIFSALEEGAAADFGRSPVSVHFHSGLDCYHVHYNIAI